ncbi:hypothetical protein IFM89_000478 [Coptis chinensis]|uniref:Uncharacterized protein n=1 Tax=Coptis chinensis TaxID=261450 RepID=A0A835LCY6_9MAGN|nr:hypothetical protein IFM89_000478 [Coptis chinensis]
MLSLQKISKQLFQKAQRLATEWETTYSVSQVLPPCSKDIDPSPPWSYRGDLVFTVKTEIFIALLMDDEVGMSPVLAPKQKDTPKEEPIDNSPSKTLAGSVKGTPSAPKSAKAKRKVHKVAFFQSGVDDCSAPADTTSLP